MATCVGSRYRVKLKMTEKKERWEIVRSGCSWVIFVDAEIVGSMKDLGIVQGWHRVSETQLGTGREVDGQPGQGQIYANRKAGGWSLNFITFVCSVALSLSFVHLFSSSLQVLMLYSHCTGSPSASDISKILNKSQSTNGKFSIVISLFPTFLCILQAF